MERSEAGIQCCHLQWCSVLLGSHLQVSFSHHSSVLWRLPRRIQQCGGTTPSRCPPAWTSHHTFPPCPTFLSSTAKKGTCKYRNCAHTAVVSSTNFRTCHRTSACKFHPEQGLTVCAIASFEITGIFPWAGASCMHTGRK